MSDIQDQYEMELAEERLRRRKLQEQLDQSGVVEIIETKTKQLISFHLIAFDSVCIMMNLIYIYIIIIIIIAFLYF